MLAGLLEWSQATFISKIDIDGDSALVEREVDDGIESIKVKLPAVITTDLRLNEPRYATLPNVMKAKSKPLDEINISDYGIDTTSNIEVLEVSEPVKRSAGIMVQDVDDLVDKLKNEAKVIS